MIKQGTLSVVQQDKAIAAIQSGGKTVDELTGNFFLFALILSVIIFIIYLILQYFLLIY